MRFRALLLALALAAPACRGRPAPPSATVTPAARAAVRASATPRPTAGEHSAPRPRIGALATRVLIYDQARRSSEEIGALHLGDVVALRDEKAKTTPDCARGFRAIEPEGWVCLDADTTLDVDEDPIIAAKRGHHADFASPTPLHWSVSREALLYKKLPTESEQAKAEFELAKHLRRAEALRSARAEGREPDRAFAALEGVDLRRAGGEIPGFFALGAPSPRAQFLPRSPSPRAKWIPSRSAIAWTDEFFAEGRSWVLTDDLLIAPKDKLVALEPSSFRGVHFEGDLGPPVAFIRREPRAKYRLLERAADVTPVAWDVEQGHLDDEALESGPGEGDPLSGFHEDPTPGRLEETPSSFARLAWVGLTGRFRKQGRQRFLETTDAGAWIRERDATIVQTEPPRGFDLAAGEKWIDVSIFRGTLVAYEGRRAVFATLISPGANGYKRVDGVPGKYTTPTGTFRIEWKHLSTTMTPDPERMSYFLAEVPYTQFFHMPFALHAAYWHDRFGEPKSGGCVNLSPIDAKWLFAWTTPAVPAGWHGVRSGGDRGPGTWVRVR
jgi:L,D-transpeptidase catalytic domain